MFHNISKRKYIVCPPHFTTNNRLSSSYPVTTSSSASTSAPTLATSCYPLQHLHWITTFLLKLSLKISLSAKDMLAGTHGFIFGTSIIDKDKLGRAVHLWETLSLKLSYKKHELDMPPSSHMQGLPPRLLLLASTCYVHSIKTTQSASTVNFILVLAWWDKFLKLWNGCSFF